MASVHIYLQGGWQAENWCLPACSCRNSSSWVGDITDFLVLMINPKHWRMWVRTSKCCAGNTANMQSIDLQVWGTRIPSLHRGKELWSGHSAVAYTGFLRSIYLLFGEGIIQGLIGAASRLSCSLINISEGSVSHINSIWPNSKHLQLVGLYNAHWKWHAHA